jgi:PleD family two-component response regulator
MSRPILSSRYTWLPKQTNDGFSNKGTSSSSIACAKDNEDRNIIHQPMNKQDFRILIADDDETVREAVRS